ncbi:MAG: sulfite exporter TauE/SafE family protein [Rhodocyclaceae bacterium]
MEQLAIPIAGFFVGALVGLTGVGGGALMTPLLLLVFGVAPQTAVGTDLLFAAVTKSFGAWAHGSRGSVDWPVVGRLCLGSLHAAAAALVFLGFFPIAATRQGLILHLLGGALIATSLAMLFKHRLNALGRHLRTGHAIRFKRAQPALTVLAGAILGSLVTLTSVGAGALGVVMLVYLYPFRMSSAKLVGTDIAHAIPLTVVAGLGHLSLGNIDFGLLGGLLSGSVPGIVLGARIGNRLRDTHVRGALAAILMLVGAKLVA